MRIGREKINDDGWRDFRCCNQTINRRSKMEQKVMKTIMRLVVVGSFAAIAMNIMVVFG